MPKIKMISRNPDDYLRETKKDIHKLPRNYNPELHPFQPEREYVRALNATKLERVFAKPFLGALDGHTDGVHCMVRHPTVLSTVISGSYDGEIRVWNIPKKKTLATVRAHQGYVRGLDMDCAGEAILSVGDDKTIKHWAFDPTTSTATFDEPKSTCLSKTMLMDISHHAIKPSYVTTGECVQLWDEGRAVPVREYQWGVDTVSRVAFNPVETELFGAVGSDRSIMLCDSRAQTGLRKVILKLRSNALAWNPMEAFNFTVANEDYNLYTFDMRQLKTPVNLHMNHIAAVMDVSYSPTGREFVSGSYDKTIRIWTVERGRSREVYHTKRMQRVMCVCFTGDGRYILSGSDEMNIRLWKTNASEKLGTLRPREETSMEYNAKLKEKYASHPEIRRINRHRHVPKHVYNAAAELRTINQSHKRKEANLRAHSRPGAVPYIPETQKHTVEELE